MRLVILSLLFSIFTHVETWSQDNDFGQSEKIVRQWPDRFWNEISKNVDRSGSQLVNLIFDQIDDFSYTFDEGKFISTKAGIRRSVYDNQDILGTWTVKDQFKLEMSKGHDVLSLPIIPSFVSPLTFNIGINGQVNIFNIRQVNSFEYQNIPTTEEIQNAFNEGHVSENVFNSKWFEFDPSVRPRTAKIWNPLITITKIPWTKKLFTKLLPGELISYSTSGTLTTGIKMGIIPHSFISKAKLSFSVSSVFLSGEFRITVLKENDRYAKVKVTKISAKGHSISGGTNQEKFEFFKGFTVLGNHGVGKYDVKIVPFEFGVRKERRWQHDLGFRYDMTNELAVDAYENALVGNFKPSEELAQNRNGVEHILSRNSFNKTRLSSLRLGVDWLYEFKNTKKRDNLWADVTLPEGEKKIFKSTTELSKSWSNVAGNGERRSYQFISVIDQTAFEANRPNSFQFITEGLIEDVQTSSRELHQYIKEVESITADNSVIPDLPIFVPGLSNEDEKNKNMKKASYGRSSFYYGQYFSQDQVIKFLTTPDDLAKKISDQSFAQFDLNKSRAFYKAWMKLKARYFEVETTQDMIEVLNTLSNLFKIFSKSCYGMRAILLSLKGEEIDFFITASNRSFGRVQFRGKKVTNAEKLLELADKSINFESSVGNYRSDAGMEIKNFKVVQLANGDLKLNFNLPVNSQFVFLRVLRSSGWKKIKNLKEVVFVNKGKFSSGSNEWIISQKYTSALSKSIWESFEKTEYYTVQMSVSKDSFSWGRIVDSRFKFDHPDDDIKKQNSDKSVEDKRIKKKSKKSGSSNNDH